MAFAISFVNVLTPAEYSHPFDCISNLVTDLVLFHTLSLLLVYSRIESYLVLTSSTTLDINLI
jgi:hypothetical protein